MSVRITMVAVSRNVSTQFNHLSAGVAVVMNSPAMGNIAMVSISNGNCASIYTDFDGFHSTDFLYRVA